MSNSLWQVNCCPQVSSVRGTVQVRILERVAISSSRGSSWPRDRTHSSRHVSCIRWILYHWAPGGCPYCHRYNTLNQGSQPILFWGDGLILSLCLRVWYHVSSEVSLFEVHEFEVHEFFLTQKSWHPRHNHKEVFGQHRSSFFHIRWSWEQMELSCHLQALPLVMIQEAQCFCPLWYENFCWSPSCAGRPKSFYLLEPSLGNCQLRFCVLVFICIFKNL